MECINSIIASELVYIGVCLALHRISYQAPVNILVPRCVAFRITPVQSVRY